MNTTMAYGTSNGSFNSEKTRKFMPQLFIDRSAPPEETLLTGVFPVPDELRVHCRQDLSALAGASVQFALLLLLPAL